MKEGRRERRIGVHWRVVHDPEPRTPLQQHHEDQWYDNQQQESQHYDDRCYDD